MSQWIKRLAIPVLWLLCLVGVIRSGWEPNLYLIHVRQIPPPHPYPTGLVVFIGVMMTLHASLLYAVLRPASYQRSWGRALGAFVVSLPFLCVGALFAMHSPPAYGPFVIWLFGWQLVTLILFLVSIISASFRRLAS